MLNREQILGADDARPESIDIPEWGGPVRLRAMNGLELIAYEAGMPRDATTMQLCARIAAFTIVDEAGERLFTEADIPALEARNARALLRLGSRAMLINRLSDSAMAEAEKKSAPSPSGGSLSNWLWSWASRTPIICWLTSRPGR